MSETIPPINALTQSFSSERELRESSKEEQRTALKSLLKRKSEDREELLKRDFYVKGGTQDVHTPLSISEDGWKLLDNFPACLQGKQINVGNAEMLDYPYGLGIINDYDFRLFSDNRPKNRFATQIYFNDSMARARPIQLYLYNMSLPKPTKTLGFVNVPYNGPKENDSCNTDTVYPEHIRSVWAHHDEILAIIPARWFQSSETKEFRDFMIYESGLKKMKYYPDKDLMPPADVKGGFVWVYCEKGYIGPVTFDAAGVITKRYWFKKLGCIFIDRETEDIVRLIQAKIELKKLTRMSDLYRRNGEIQTDDERITENRSSKNDTLCRMSRGRSGFINPNQFNTDSTQLSLWKVVAPLAQGVGYNCVENFDICPPNEVATSSFFSIVSPKSLKKECEAIIRFNNLKLNKFLSSVKKSTQAVTSSCFEYIPALWNEINTDAEYYKYMGLTPELIAFVESMVP